MLNRIGNKSKLLPSLLPLFPAGATTFIDLFAGSLSVSFAMLDRAKKVSQHASLEKIDKQAWKKIATNFSSQCSRGNNDDVAENATNVANIFSEGLLRDIIQLTPAATSRRARD